MNSKEFLEKMNSKRIGYINDFFKEFKYYCNNCFSFFNKTIIPKIDLKTGKPSKKVCQYCYSKDIQSKEKQLKLDIRTYELHKTDIFVNRVFKNPINHNWIITLILLTSMIFIIWLIYISIFKSNFLDFHFK